MSRDAWTTNGRTLAAWLMLLADADHDRRLAAAEALRAMSAAWLAEGARSESARDAHQRAFAAATTAILLDPASDGLALLQRLVEVVRHCNCERLAATSCRRSDLFRIKSECGGLLARSGEVMLRWPTFAKSCLSGEGLPIAGSVCRAIGSLGSRGLFYAADLFAAAALRKPEYRSPFYKSLALIGRDDPATIRGLADLARSRDGRAALTALAETGPSILRFVPTLVDDLMPSIEADDAAAAWRLSELSRIDPTRRDVFERLLTLARPSPPQVDFGTAANGQSYPFDRVMLRRAHAISALARFTAFADEAASALVDSLPTFRESDPMWDYSGGRIRTVLTQLGQTDAMMPDALRRPPTPRPAGG